MRFDNIQFKEMFSEILNFISITNNIIQFALFFMAIIALCYIFSVKYIRPIRLLLYPLGLKKRLIIKILLLCRKDSRKNIRIFCEYFILKTQGVHQNSMWWEDAFYEFSAFFKDSIQDRYIYELDNCTDILNEDVSNYINKYFTYFNDADIRKKFDLNQKQPIFFCMQIKIVQGFLSPNVLLSGLLERYKNNWGNLVEKYISCASNEKYADKAYSSEVYYTFAWLLWGPSYQVRNQEGHYKLCQYAFGDESNSVNVILNNKENLKILWSNINDNSNGVLCSLTCRLFNAKKYIEYYRDNFSPVNTYFINKVSDESVSYLLEPIEYDMKKNYKAQNYYCTAYVWIMFESIVNENDCFQPQRAITFFEHANIANQLNYEACINSLISKSFDHFDKIFSDNEVTRKYRYCLSMNKTIEDIFIDRFRKKINNNSILSEQYKNQFSLEKIYSESDIFCSFDSYFTDVADDFSFVVVKINDKNSLALLGEYYTSVYLDSFPDVNERESLDSIIDYLTKKSNGWYEKSNYHVILIVKSGKTVGGLICDYFAHSNCGVIEFIAVKEEYQSIGIGTRIYQHALEIMRKDAKRNGHIDIDYIICEIEKIGATSTIEEEKYLWFWEKMGYKKLKFDYIQPALDSSKSGVFTLDLIALQVNTHVSTHNGISVEKIRIFLLEYAQYAMRIENPKDNIHMISMTNSLGGIESNIVGFDKVISRGM